MSRAVRFIPLLDDGWRRPDYTADDIITDCMENIKALGAKYDCDVMIGGNRHGMR